MTMNDFYFIDTKAIEWENGLDSIAKMAPEFRNNLGPPDKLEGTFSKYNMKLLHSDPLTTKRGELIHVTSGYADLTPSYHDSVEECLILEGECYIHGEGTFRKGDYFWRPPGWVHWVESKNGFDAILFHEGTSEKEKSGPSSRRVRPNEECGTNQLHNEHNKAIGPRGWIKRLTTTLLQWQPGAIFARSEGSLGHYDLNNVFFKVLSKNYVAGSQTLLVKLEKGYQQSQSGVHSASQEIFILSGSVKIGNKVFKEGCYVYKKGGSVHPAMFSEEGAELLMKTDGLLDFEHSQYER